jgi:hypothetical protein
VSSLREELLRLKQELPPPVIAVGEDNGVQRIVDLRRLPGRPANVL